MRSNGKILRLFDLPVFSTLDEFATLSHFDRDRVSIIATEAFRFYKRYPIPKKMGGVRFIFQPTREVKAIQAWILRNILDKLKPSAVATAFVRGIGLKKNALPHRTNRYFLNLDLVDFFPSLGSWQVQSLFEALGYSQPASSLLTKLCTVFFVLPQGAVTSPSLSNLLCLRLDRRLIGYAASKGFVFTRYADDLTFSSNNPLVLRKAIHVIVRIVGSERLSINHRKIRLTGPDGHCEITGLVKNSSSPDFGIGRIRYRKLRAEIHRLESGEMPERYRTEASVSGMISYIKGVDPASYSRLVEYRKKLSARKSLPI